MQQKINFTLLSKVPYTRKSLREGLLLKKQHPQEAAKELTLVVANEVTQVVTNEVT